MRGMVVAGALALVVLAGGCTSGAAKTTNVASTSPSDASTTYGGEPAAEVEATPDGSRSNPYPLGTVVRVGRWEVMLSDENRGETGHDQSQTVPEGAAAVSVGVKATLVDIDGIPENEEVSAWASLLPGFVTPDGTSHGEESACVLAAGGWDDSMPTFSGAGTAEGRFCTLVPADAVEEGTWALTEDASGTTVFFAPVGKCAVVAPTC